MLPDTTVPVCIMLSRTDQFPPGFFYATNYTCPAMTPLISLYIPILFNNFCKLVIYISLKKIKLYKSISYNNYKKITIQLQKITTFVTH